MKRFLLALLLLAAGPLATRAATPTFSSFYTNDFTVVTNLTAPWIIHASTNHAGTNGFTTINVTNLYVTNLVIGGFQLILATNAPSITPTNSSAFYIDGTINQLWVWDSTSNVWIAINPALASGNYTLPTVADLRLVHDNGYLQWATTRGNVVATDGQGRNYWWDPSATDVDDGIAVIDLSEHLAAEAGRWLEQ